MSNPRSLAVILNTARANTEVISDAVEAVRVMGHDVILLPLQDPADLASELAVALDAKCDIVVAVGGDGTLSALINAVADLDAFEAVGIGVVPAGTANDFATACGIPTDPAEALEIAASARMRAVDIGQVNGRCFVNAATGGFGAEITATTPAGLKHSLGGFAYLVNGLIHIPQAEGKPARVSAGDTWWEGNLIGFTVANARMAGGGFEVAPTAKIDDGELDLVLFPEIGEGVWSGLVSDLFKDRAGVDDDDLDYLVACRTSRIVIQTEELLQLNVDGEPLQDNRFSFEVISKKIRFAIPDGPLLSGS